MKKFINLVLVFAFCLTSFALVGCKKKDNLPDLSKSLTNYKINLDFDAVNKQAKANASVEYKNNSNTALNNIYFHLYPQFFKEGYTEYIVPSTKMNNAYPNGVSYAKFDISRVQVGGADVAIKYIGEADAILDVGLNKNLLPNSSIKIDIDFTFSLPNCYHRFGYGNNTINIANFYPVACVLEDGQFNISPYNANGDPFYSDVANYEVSLTTDANYVVASTGQKQEENINGNKKSYKYKAEVVRDFAVVLSNKFKVITENINEVEVNYYYFDDAQAERSLKTGVNCLNTFGNLFGAYPYKTFNIVQTDFIQGGMEYPNLVMISSAIDNGEDYCNVIVHETAHQWWYGVVGNDEFKYPWLDEALTDYCTVLFYDYNEGYKLTHKGMIEIDRANYRLFKTVYEDVLGTIDTSMRPVNEYDTEPEYTYCTYVKGVLMYESLYTLIGQKNFIKGLKTYYQNNAFKNVTPTNLITAFEEASKMDLKQFFDSWISGKVIIM